MISALEAKLTAFRKRYGNIVENKIIEAASKGDMMCTISADEIPNSVKYTLHEIASILHELGYQTSMDENENTLNIYWIITSIMNYNWGSEIERDE